jgi:hypothetical protein
LNEITGLPKDLVMNCALKPRMGQRIVAEAVAL